MAVIALWWALTHHGPIRYLSGILAVAAPIAAAVYYTALGLLWAALGSSGGRDDAAADASSFQEFVCVAGPRTAASITESTPESAGHWSAARGAAYLRAPVLHHPIARWF